MAKKAYIGVKDGTGKNLLNMNYAAFNADIYSGTKNNALAAAQANAQYKENTQYTLSWSTTAPADSVASAFFQFEYTDGTKSGYIAIIGMSANPPILPGPKQVVSAVQKTLKDVTYAAGVNGEFLLEYIQLEEGATATDYEPYGSGASVARKIKKGYVGVYQNTIINTHGLPSEYTELEYIESTGTQYINTGVSPDYTTGYYADFQFPTITTDDTTLMGSLDPNICISGGLGRFGYCYKSGTGETDNFGTSDTERHTFLLNYMYSLQAQMDDQVKALTAMTSTNNYPAFIFATNYAGSVYGAIPAKLFRAKITKGTTLVRDFIPAKRNSNSVLGLYDLVDSKFYTNAGSGSFVAGATVTDIPAGTYARKIKKAYIGIGGVARPCWSGGELAYYGTVTPFSPEGGNSMASGTVGNYAVFAGGYGHYYNKTVDAYSRELIHSNPTELGTARTNVAGASVGNYFLTAGGYNGGSSKSVVETYDTNLTRGSATALPVNVYNSLCGQVKDYAIFAGGYDYGAKANRAEAVAYNESLTRQTITSLSKATSGTSSVSMDDYVIMIAGTMACVYRSDLTRSDITASSMDRGAFRGAKVGKNTVFAGGHNASGAPVSLAESYDEDFTRTMIDSLQTARFDLMAAALGDYAIFAGGSVNTSNGRTNAVEIYDEHLTRSTTTSLNVARANGGNATIGDYALIASGSASSGYSPVVDAYTLV